MQRTEIRLIPIFEDNYIFVGRAGGAANYFAVDPGEPRALNKFLSERSAGLDAILMTHEHSDHIGGVMDLAARFPACKVIGPPSVRRFLPHLERRFHVPNDNHLEVAGLKFEVRQWPGHTTDHWCYWLAAEESLFCGDTLFGLGCGRVISGTLQQMFETLQALKQLPSSSRIYCAHEYSLRNLSFLRQKRTLFPPSFRDRENFSDARLDLAEAELRKRLETENATVPLKLEFEATFNPFLRAVDFGEFEEIRKLRNQF